MTIISHLRAGMFASVLLLSTSLAVPAFAKDAQLLPNLSPTDIARDVTREINNRTGIEEFVAPTFDPFEEDRTMAGSVNLRSVGGGVTSIEGETFSEGAMLDLVFYYNTPNDDPYGGRDFKDVAFLSGSFAPAVKRDNRIIECSRNVEDVVYDDNFYYAPLLALSLHRPYRHYGGHRRFGRFDRPFWRNRGYGNHSGWSRGGSSRRGYSRHSDYGRSGSARRDGTSGRDGRRDSEIRNRDENRNNDRSRDRHHENRVATPAPYVRGDRRGRMRGAGNDRPLRAENNQTNNARSNNTRRTETRRTETRRGETRRNETRPASSTRATQRNDRNVRSDSRRNARSQPQTDRRTEARRESRPRPSMQPREQAQTSRRNESRPAPRTRTATPKRESNRAVLNTIKSNRKGGSAKARLKRGLDFFPKRSNYGRNVVRNVEVDCAREETLSVFIPAARLEAARFDGLTVLALDNKGQEYPIFVPPNYIEGFEAAIGGQYASVSGRNTAVPNTVYRAPYTPPATSSTRIEGECPIGTQKQPNGTCLVVDGAYP